MCMYLLCYFIHHTIPYLDFFFFFSSRRRHTISLRDWSSDVCSSDLAADGMGRHGNRGRVCEGPWRRAAGQGLRAARDLQRGAGGGEDGHLVAAGATAAGRGSGRRGERAEGGGVRGPRRGIVPAGLVGAVCLGGGIWGKDLSVLSAPGGGPSCGQGERISGRTAGRGGRAAGGDPFARVL